MKHDITRQRADPVLDPNHLSVARPLRTEDLDRYLTWHGIYPSQPASPGVPWSAYVDHKGIGQGQSHPLLKL